jgi:hypothetical protein
MPDQPDSNPAIASQIGDRYTLHELLGRGGMASVYRASDLATGREVALKQLTVADARESASVATLFEREFRTLKQLQHPHVISVYDFGIDADGHAYYTMELLDGGDLRERAPLPYREACRLLFEVCSSLALLHSRRLLHRDIGPRNIRCTKDGKAKLIDFGAMAPMSSGGADVVGTPAFTAPETLHRSAVDARTDLFSLGVTLYYALTGRLPYPAKTFADVVAAWGCKVVPPSVLVPEVPIALDDLVLSLISLEPASRPQTAFDVMQQLAACAGIRPEESGAVSRAYLVTPTLVGRADALAASNDKLLAASQKRGSALMLHGQPGVGRSRFLDAAALQAQTLGFSVARASAGAARAAFGVVHTLIARLLDGLSGVRIAGSFPEIFAPGAAAADVPAGPLLRDFADPQLDPARLRDATCRLLATVSRSHRLLLVVDDVQRIDTQSAAVLAELIDSGRRSALVILLAVPSDQTDGDALHALSARCERIELAPLTHPQTRELLASMFGDVLHLEMLSDELYALTQGNPRECIEVSQYLVDRGVIRYASGTWTLPAQLSAEQLPRSGAEATRARIASLSANARRLAEAHALAFYDSLTAADHRVLLADASAVAIDEAVSELSALGALARDDSNYSLSNRVWAAAFSEELRPTDAREVHRRLAAVYTASEQMIACIHHSFSGELFEQGMKLLARRHDKQLQNIDNARMLEENVGKMVWCTGVAIELAIREGQPARAIAELRRWHYAGELTKPHPALNASGPLWRAQLVRDSGLDLYYADTSSANAAERLMRALGAAQQRYLDSPLEERVYSVEEAVRLLPEYVVYSIGLGGRMQDGALLKSLPELLEPFAPLSPLLEAFWKNALATYHSQSDCQYQRARDYWTQALTVLDALPGEQPAYMEPLKCAIAYAIGMMEAQLGLPSAIQWANRLDDDPYQRVSGLLLRKVVRLEQGDSKGAEKLARRAELVALQQPAPQMFKSLLTVEMAARTKMRDLAAIQQLLEEIRGLASRYTAWHGNLLNGEGNFELVRGDLSAAQHKFEQCIELTAPDATGESPNLAMWVASHAALAEVLLATRDLGRAREVAKGALALCERRGIDALASDIVRTLALIEAKLGEPEAARPLDALIARQTELGATGLRLGLSYEARAQIALWSGDQAGFDHYAQLTAREYRHGAASPLGARYERLMNEASRAGMLARFSLADFALGATTDRGTSGVEDVRTLVTRTLSGRDHPAERAELALQMICASYRASAGHLYVNSPQGLVWQATCGGDAATAALATTLRQYVEREQERADDMDEMATGDLEEQPAPAVRRIELAGVQYELLLLSCVNDALETHIAGVAAVIGIDGKPHDETHTQLLRVLATHLLDTATQEATG